MKRYQTANRVLVESRDFVHGLLMMSERGMSDARITNLAGLKRTTVTTALLEAARAATAWESTAIARGIEK